MIKGIRELIKDNRTTAFYLFYFTLAPFISDSYLIYLSIRYQEQISSFTFPEYSLLSFILGLCMATGLCHTTLIATVSGYFLGINSVFIVIPTYIFASILGYFLAQKLDNGHFMNTLLRFKKTATIKSNLKNEESKIIFLSRLSPVIPFALMNFLLSVLGANFRKYLIFGTAGMLPRTLLFCYIGSKAGELIQAINAPGQESMSKAITLLLIISSLIGLYYFIKRAITKALK